MPLSIFELKMVYAGNTPNVFCRIPTTELFILNNGNSEDITHSHSFSLSNKTFFQLVGPNFGIYTVVVILNYIQFILRF